MLDPNDLLPEEQQSQQLVRQLHDIFDTHADDVKSLASIRQRLQANSATSLPVYKEADALPEKRTTRTKKANMRFIHTHFYEGKTWPQRLTTLAAVFVLVALVGSLILLLVHQRQVETAGHPVQGNIQHGIFKLPAGWREIGYYEGTGNTAILSRLTVKDQWGINLLCRGGSTKSVTVNLFENYSYVDSCRTNFVYSQVPVIPETTFLETEQNGIKVLQNISVKAESDVSWQLQIVQGPSVTNILKSYQSHSLFQSFGYGSQTFKLTEGAMILPRSWRLLDKCVGKGDIQLNLSGTDGETFGDKFACNNSAPDVYTGIPATQGAKLSQIQVTADKDSFWQFVLLDCSSNVPGCSL